MTKIALKKNNFDIAIKNMALRSLSYPVSKLHCNITPYSF